MFISPPAMLTLMHFLTGFYTAATDSKSCTFQLYCYIITKTMFFTRKVMEHYKA